MLINGSTSMDSKNAQQTKESIRVLVRCRPLNKKEIKAGNQKVVKVYPDKGAIEIFDSKNTTTKQFTFDTVYDESAKQADIYDESLRPLVDSVLQGFNGTIFAYGQTGAGKTYTIEGDAADKDKRGVIPMAFKQIFNHIEESENLEYLVSASYIEIYQENIRDLLSDDPKRTCELKQSPGGVYIKDVTVKVCKDMTELETILARGKTKRSVGATNMNIHSSRSHAIFMINVEQCEEGSTIRLIFPQSLMLKPPLHLKLGKLNLVDLAGSERQSKTGAIGERQKESIKINLSLSALGNVIAALVDGSSPHIPYRDSKLTRLLQDSLGGNSKTVMIANIGPSENNYDETLTTLRFANRAKNIKNAPIVNEDPKDALLRQYKEEIENLKAQLEAREKKFERKQQKYQPSDSESSFTGGDTMVKKLGEEMRLIEEEKAILLNNQEMLAEEKDELLDKIKHRSELLKQEQEAEAELVEKIKSLELQFLTGGKNIIDRTNEQQKRLEQQRKEIAEQKNREREILQKLTEEEDTTLEIRETYSTLRQEVEVKTKKLKKLYAKLQALKRELNEEQDINSRERQERTDNQDEVMKRLKHSHLIIDNFIHPEDKAKLLRNIYFDEDENLWRIAPVSQFGLAYQLRPNSADGRDSMPSSEYSRRMWKLTSSPKYANENVALIDLDFPALSVAEYEPPGFNPLHRAWLDHLFSGEKDIEIDCWDPRFMRKRIAYRRVRSKTSRKKPDHDESNYPTPRGLVPRN